MSDHEENNDVPPTPNDYNITALADSDSDSESYTTRTHPLWTEDDYNNPALQGAEWLTAPLQIDLLKRKIYQYFWYDNNLQDMIQFNDVCKPTNLDIKTGSGALELTQNPAKMVTFSTHVESSKEFMAPEYEGPYHPDHYDSDYLEYISKILSIFDLFGMADQNTFMNDIFYPKSKMDVLNNRRKLDIHELDRMTNKLLQLLYCISFENVPDTIEQLPRLSMGNLIQLKTDVSLLNTQDSVMKNGEYYIAPCEEHKTNGILAEKFPIRKYDFVYQWRQSEKHKLSSCQMLAELQLDWFTARIKGNEVNYANFPAEIIYRPFYNINTQSPFSDSDTKIISTFTGTREHYMIPGYIINIFYTYFRFMEIQHAATKEEKYRRILAIKTLKIPHTTKTISLSGGYIYKFETITAFKNIQEVLFDHQDNVLENGETTIEPVSELTEIGAFCFDKFLGLERIRIPRSVKTIGDSAFINLKHLTHVVLPPININERLFSGASQLKSIEFHLFTEHTENNRFIAYAAFRNTRITTIRIPSNYTRFFSGCFRDIPTLTDIYIEKSDSNQPIQIDGDICDRKQQDDTKPVNIHSDAKIQVFGDKFLVDKYMTFANNTNVTYVNRNRSLLTDTETTLALIAPDTPPTHTSTRIKPMKIPPRAHCFSTKISPL